MLSPMQSCYVGAIDAAADVGNLVEANGFVFVPSRLGLRGGRICGRDVISQTNGAIASLASALAHAGLGLEHVAQMTVWLTRPADFDGCRRALDARFGRSAPARTVVVSSLIVPGALVAIDAIAARPAQPIDDRRVAPATP